MRTGLCTDVRFREHLPPGSHPEGPDRLVAIEHALAARGLTPRCAPVLARPATRAELELAHDAAFLDRLEDLLDPMTATGASGRTGRPGERARAGSGWIDPDTYYSPGSWTAALLAAGGGIDLARAVSGGQLDAGLALLRPPGHHATRDRAMGFCLLNNIAVAAAALRSDGARVAIVDFDVHHGNGTEAIFYGDAEVLYVSTHQHPFYPGTGAVEDRGAGLGLGANVNVPLPAGAGDAAYLAAMDRVVVPVLRRFGADVLLLSAGFDAHHRDPLASMNVSSEGFGVLTARLLDVAGGKLAAFLEGGYDLDALGESVAACLSVLLGDGVPPLDLDPMAPAEAAAVERARRACGAP